MTVQSRKTRNQRASVEPSDFKEAVAVQHHSEQPPNVKSATTIPRDDRNQFLFTPRRIVIALDSRWDLPRAGRQVRKKATNLCECFVLRLDFVVHRAAAASVNVRSAQLFLVDVLANATNNYQRPGDEELTRAFHHQRELRVDHPHRSKARHRPHAAADYGDFRHQRHDYIPRGIRRDVSPLSGLERLHASAATRAVNEPYDRQLEFASQSFAVACFVADPGI